MNPMGTKVSGRYSRLISAFKEPVELGIVVPMDDYKFLRAYELFTLNGNHSDTDTYLTLDNAMGNEISKNYILDLDGNYIRNALIGPSTFAGSKNISQLRAGKQHTSITTRFEIDKGVAEDLRMDLTDNDPVVIARRPQDWGEWNIDTEDGETNCTVRTPQMVGISKHTNTLMYNFSAETITVIELPLTDEATIDPNFSYRFSFYYRANGLFSLIPEVRYYTNSGAYISHKRYSTNALNLSDSETSDFRLFQIGIPRTTFSEIIPTEAKRVVIAIEIQATWSTKFELAYPVLEHAAGLSAVSGYIFIPEPPSDIDIKETDSGILSLSPVRTNIPIDSAKLFYSHLGRKLFDIGLDFSIMDSTFVYQLRVLDQMNKMGYKIALRPKHPSLPPVLIGSLRVDTKNPSYDYHVNDLTLLFEEVM